MRPGALDPTAPSAGVYASQYGNPATALGGSISLYAIPDSNNAAPVCTSGKATAINGIGVDASGTLWVPGSLPGKVSSPTNDVFAYAANTCTPNKTKLTETNGQGSDIAFASTGTIYVLDVLDKSYVSGLISVYPAGNTKPASTLKLPGIGRYDPNTGKGGLALGIATDAADNVYASYENTHGGTDIAVFAGGAGPGKILQRSPSTTYEGLTFDANGNLLAAGEVSGRFGAIYVFQPPYNAFPSAQIPTFAASIPVDLKLDPANANLYVSDVSNGTIDVYAYPKVTYEYSISNGLVASYGVEGVAVDPAASALQVSASRKR